MRCRTVQQHEALASNLHPDTYSEGDQVAGATVFLLVLGPLVGVAGYCAPSRFSLVVWSVGFFVMANWIIYWAWFGFVQVWNVYAAIAGFGGFLIFSFLLPYGIPMVVLLLLLSYCSVSIILIAATGIDTNWNAHGFGMPMLCVSNFGRGSNKPPTGLGYPDVNHWQFAWSVFTVLI
ncbi:hypothetical protein U1Q18_012545 [Sarracenia purpurea var. burkii]